MENALGLMTESTNEAIRTAVRQEKKHLLNFIRRRVSSEADAEDILQDVFYQFVAAMQLETIERATSWLFRVAGNKIIDLYRRRKAVSLDELNAGGEPEGESLHLEDILFDPSDSPDAVYLRQSIWALLDEALGELPSEQREVFVLHELEGKSFRDISLLTDTPVNTLLSRKRYAVLFLRERLREAYDELLGT